MSKAKLNLATKITLIRILSVPFIIITALYEWFGTTLVLFTIAALSDALDGFIARQWNQKSYLGSILDPFADKMLLTTLFVIFTMNIKGIHFRLSNWLTVSVIFRDALIVFGCFMIYFITGKLNPKPLFIGKVTTLFQLLTLFIVISINSIKYFVNRPEFSENLLRNVSFLTLVFTMLSGIGYIRLAIQIILDYTNSNSEPA